MSRILWAVLIAAMAGGAGAAQSTPAAEQPAATTETAPGQNHSTFPAGTMIPVELSKTLDAKKAKAGDKIEARIPADVLSHGKIVIPRTARMIGHVTEAKPHSKESPDSRVGVAFDRLVMKDGQEVPLQAAVQAISRPLQLVQPDSYMDKGAGMASGSSAAAGGTIATRSPERVASVPMDASGTEPVSTVAPLAATSQGVVGMKGLALTSSGQSSVVSSQTGNVRLESGTQMILRVQ